MKAAQMNTSFRRRLIAALLISGLLPFLGVARESQCGQKVPDTFNYPQSQETIQVDAEIKSRSLSGVVTDPSGAVASQVLVERVRPGWENGSPQFLPILTGTSSLREPLQGLIF